MEILVRAQGFELSEAIDTFVRRETGSALERFDEDIVSVSVFLKDTNGPKGGVDKQVVLKLHLRGRPQVALHTTRENLYAAIRVSIKRAKRAVRRTLLKGRRVEKSSLRRLGADAHLKEVARSLR